jgi:hypothetical protein
MGKDMGQGLSIIGSEPDRNIPAPDMTSPAPGPGLIQIA